MRIAVFGADKPKLLIYGTLLGLRYPLERHTSQQTISFGMFMNAIGRIVKTMGSDASLGRSNSENVVQGFLRYMIQELGYIHEEPDWLARFYVNHCKFHLPIPGNEAIAKTASFELHHNQDGDFEFDVKIVHKDKKHIETSILVNWLSLDYSFSTNMLTMEDHTLPLGMWLAARLYECSGDLAGKMATIDEALDKL